jgi:hypothetical protein
MKSGGSGGWKTGTGIRFEGQVALAKKLAAIPGYGISKTSGRAGVDIFFENQLVARCFQKHDFYRFLEELGVDWQNRISKRLLPDNCILVVDTKSVFVIEIKYQQVAGSVDEKLQTCHFKLKQYRKLLANTGYNVFYRYVFNDWFSKMEYKDVLEYIRETGCHYSFKELDLGDLGLPVSS